MRLQQHSWVNHGTHSWITDVESDITFASRQILFLNVSSSEKIPWLIPKWEINKCFSNQIFVNCDFVQCSSKNWPSKNYFSKIIGRKSDEFLSILWNLKCVSFWANTVICASKSVVIPHGNSSGSEPKILWSPFYIQEIIRFSPCWKVWNYGQLQMSLFNLCWPLSLCTWPNLCSSNEISSHYDFCLNFRLLRGASLNYSNTFSSNKLSREKWRFFSILR